MSSDVGGFVADGGVYEPELYTRWLQMGVFSPVLRTHAQYKPEPYHYSRDRDVLLKFIRTRYEWLPYNYTLAYENSALRTAACTPCELLCRTGHSKRRLPRRVSLGPGCPCGTRHGEGGARSRKVGVPGRILMVQLEQPRAHIQRRLNRSGQGSAFRTSDVRARRKLHPAVHPQKWTMSETMTRNS